MCKTGELCINVQDWRAVHQCARLGRFESVAPNNIYILELERTRTYLFLARVYNKYIFKIIIDYSREREHFGSLAIPRAFFLIIIIKRLKMIY